MSQVAGGIAHDFNNLLTAILGYADVTLRVGNLGERERGNLTQILGAGQRAAALTGQLLAFAGRQARNPQRLSLSELVERSAPGLRKLLPEGIELIVRCAAQAQVAEADPDQLEQVLSNLVCNAAEAMPEGGRLGIETFDVRLDEEYTARYLDARPGDYVLLTVSDTGHGMSDEVRRRIFEPYFTTKPRGSGPGLGLSVVHGEVTSAGGLVHVYSEPGLGTTVKVYLPAQSGPAGVEQAAGTAEPASMPGGTETILVAEDNTAVLEFVAGMLRGLGYTVIESADPSGALAQAAERPDFDLLITDVVMPGIGGRELAAELSQQRPELPVLFISGFAQDAVLYQGQLESGLHFLAKPFSPGELAARVRGILDRK